MALGTAGAPCQETGNFASAAGPPILGGPLAHDFGIIIVQIIRYPRYIIVNPFAI